MKGLPIGSVQPWVGPLTQIPKGWLLANGAELQAREYPLLARILKNTYGGVNFSGGFPNYSGTFRLPPTNQKGLADINISYFSDNPLLRNNKMDTTAAAAVVQQYIGDIGDLGTPSTVFANTDMNFTYEPDPDGVVLTFQYAGAAPSTTIAQKYDPAELTLSTNGNGSGITFQVVQNTNLTYSVKIISRGQDFIQGEIIKILGSSFTKGTTVGTSPANDITITVQSTGDGFFDGRIEGQSVIPGFGIKTVYVIGRKLSREHFPAHFHPSPEGGYRTINKGDSGDNPGLGVGVFDTPEISVTGYWWRKEPCPVIAGTCDNETQKLTERPRVYDLRWGSETGTIQDGLDNVVSPGGMVQPFVAGAGRYAIASVEGSIPFKFHRPERTSIDRHGVGKSWFNQAKKLRVTDTVTSPGESYLASLINDSKLIAGISRIPFSDESNAVASPNYDNGGGSTSNGLSDGIISPPTQVLLNTGAVNYNVTQNQGGNVVTTIQPHDHGSEFNITYNGDALSVTPRISAKVQPVVTPDNVENAFQMTFTVTSPSLSCIHLVRAY
jgi:microcystin-dependent protein